MLYIDIPVNHTTFTDATLNQNYTKYETNSFHRIEQIGRYTTSRGKKVEYKNYIIKELRYASSLHRRLTKMRNWMSCSIY